MKQHTPLFIILLALLLLAACNPAPTATPAPTQTPLVEKADSAPEPSATPAPTATSAPLPTPTATVTPSPTLNPIMATMEAMKKKVTVAPATPVSGGAASIAADDYMGMFELAWNKVKKDYVRGNFNGADWDKIHETYLPKFQAISTHEEFETLMAALINELHDNHSRFVPASRFASEFDLPDESTGQPWPGMTVWPAREDEYLFVWYVCQQGGAASAGVHRGDIILAIEGEEVKKEDGKFPRQTIRKIYQGDGKITLTLWQGPDTEPKEVTIRYREAAGCDGWYSTLIAESPRIGYIRVPEYSGNAEANILSMIHELEADAPLDGLIYDERHNPGGNADAAIAIFTTGTFGERGKLRPGATRTIWRIRGPVKWNETTPMIVLTDGASHSAAEYFATAMKQSGRATLVGMPTAGNTEGITGFSLPDGSLIRLAVETLILPSGETMEETGVIPDVEVPLGQWGLRQTPDLQLQRAIELLLP